MVAQSLDLGVVDKAFLDELARATLDESRSDELARLHADERLRLPAIIDSYSPALRPEQMPLRVKLAPGIVSRDC